MQLQLQQQIKNIFLQKICEGLLVFIAMEVKQVSREKKIDNWKFKKNYLT